MAVTLRDIADQSGVSMKTVSRVLNNEPNVSDATRERVEAAATALGYRPNLAARGLASSRSFLIAMLYDDVSNSYVLSLMEGATEVCRRAGYHLIVEPVKNDSLDTPASVSRLLRRLNVDGLILTPPLSDNTALIAALDLLDMPAVRLAPFDTAGRHPVVTIDNFGAAREVTEHLLAIGHTRIGFIAGAPSHSATEARLAGYRDALDAAGIAADDALIADGDFTWRSGFNATAELMGQTPTAIFASNDDMAAGALSWLGRNGYRVPEDVAVAGFDDTSLSRVVHPALTTVWQDVVQMGRLSAELLTERRTAHADHRFAHKLVVRASSAPSVSDPSGGPSHA